MDEEVTPARAEGGCTARRATRRARRYDNNDYFKIARGFLTPCVREGLSCRCRPMYSPPFSDATLGPTHEAHTRGHARAAHEEGHHFRKRSTRLAPPPQAYRPATRTAARLVRHCTAHIGRRATLASPSQGCHPSGGMCAPDGCSVERAVFRQLHAALTASS